MALFQWFSGNLVFIIAGALLGTSSVGILKAAQNVMAFTHILFQAMENFIPSKASQKYVNEGFNSLLKYKNKIIYYGGAVTAFFACIIAMYSEYILSFVYDATYAEYAYVLQWFSVIYLFMFLGFPYRAALRAIENTKGIFVSQMLASLFVLCFGWPLIGTFALQGALVALLSVYVIAAGYLHYTLKCEPKKQIVT